jgi:hypothetical protein
MPENDKKPDEGHTKYAVECDPKKPLPKDEKTAAEGCGSCGGEHKEVEGKSE